MKKPSRNVSAIPVDHVRYPVIYWHCASTKEEKAVADKALDTVKDVFELRERLCTELAQLMRECEERGRGREALPQDHPKPKPEGHPQYGTSRRPR